MKSLIRNVDHFNGCLYIEISNLWNTLYRFFNFTQSYQVDISLLEEISFKEALTQASFSRKELLQAIKKYNNLLSPKPNKLS